MAQIKRKKVSGKAVQGQKREKGNLASNKLFWLIIGIVSVVLIATGIIVGIVVYKNKTEEEEHEDYFALTYNDSYTNNEDLTFTKMSYQGVLMHVNPDDYEEGTYYKHVFFFAFDLSQFYPDKSIDDGKDKDDEDDVFYYQQTHEEALNAMKTLQFNINKYNKSLDEESTEKAILYIIDTSIGSNSQVFSDSTFGGTDDSSASFAFGYIAGEDGYVSSYEYGTDKYGKVVEKSLCTNSMTELCTTTSTYLYDFINNKKFALELEK